MSSLETRYKQELTDEERFFLKLHAFAPGIWSGRLILDAFYHMDFPDMNGVRVSELDHKLVLKGFSYSEFTISLEDSFQAFVQWVNQDLASTFQMSSNHSVHHPFLQ